MALTFGVDRLPTDEQTCPAWPTLDSIERARLAAYRRWLPKAAPAKLPPAAAVVYMTEAQRERRHVAWAKGASR